MGKILAAITAFVRSLLRDGRSHALGAAAQATDRARAAARAELTAAATEHRVRIDPQMLMYMVTPDGYLAHAPIEGFERYQDADFETGAAVHLLVVRPGSARSLPSGSYVVCPVTPSFTQLGDTKIYAASSSGIRDSSGDCERGVAELAVP